MGTILLMQTPKDSFKNCNKKKSDNIEIMSDDQTLYFPSIETLRF